MIITYYRHLLSFLQSHPYLSSNFPLYLFLFLSLFSLSLGYIDRKHIFISHGEGATLSFLVNIPPPTPTPSTTSSTTSASSTTTTATTTTSTTTSTATDPTATTSSAGEYFRVGGGAGRGVVWFCECQKGFLKYPTTMGVSSSIVTTNTINRHNQHP